MRFVSLKDAVRDGLHTLVRRTGSEPMLAWLTPQAPLAVQSAVLRRLCPPPGAFPNGEEFSVMRGGLRFHLAPRDYFQWHHYFGFHDEVLAFLVETAKSSSTVVDVGANIGLYTLNMSRALPAGGVVVAIEANPNTAKLLTRHVAENAAANVKIVNLAVSSAPGEALLFDSGDGEPGKATLRGNAKTTGSVRVQVTTIDALMKDTKGCELIKIDVEGLEPEVLLGAAETIRSRRPTICMEWTPRWMKENWSQAIAALDLLEASGYTFSALLSDRSSKGYRLETMAARVLRDPEWSGARNIVARAQR